MGRTCFTLLSLAGLVFSLGLWVATFFRVSYTVGQSTVLLEFGSIDLLHHENPPEPTIGAWHCWGAGGWIVERLLPQYARHPAADVWSIAIPLWIPVVLFVSALWFLPVSRHILRQGKKRPPWFESVCVRLYPELAHFDSGPEGNRSLREAYAISRFTFFLLVAVLVFYVLGFAPYLRFFCAVGFPQFLPALSTLPLAVLAVLMLLGASMLSENEFVARCVGSY